MSAMDFVLDFSASETYECGAALLALLAYPVDTGNVRDGLRASLCANYLRNQYSLADDAVPPLAKSVYAFRSERDVKKDLKTLDRRLRDRMVAARMAIGFLQEAAGTPPRLPPDVSRLSLNQLSEMVKDDAKQSDPENVESRIWRPSIPVIHIAASVAVVISNSERAGIPQTSWGDILHSRPLVEEIVHNAQLHEILIENSAKIGSKLHITVDKLIKVRLATN
jgi:hypothetical protein